MWIALRKPFKQQEVINWIRNLSGVIVTQIRTTNLDFWVMANRTVNLQSVYLPDFGSESNDTKSLPPEGPGSLGK